MSVNPLPLDAEHGTCKHCRGNIIRWPGDAHPFGRKWIHNPSKGFRYYRCVGHATVAEPT